MTVYVLSYHNSCGGNDLTDGCWGVYSSWDKARKEAYGFVESWNEEVIDTDYDVGTNVQMLFFQSGTFVIEPITLDSGMYV